jgi:hypothetical protein
LLNLGQCIESVTPPPQLALALAGIERDAIATVGRCASLVDHLERHPRGPGHRLGIGRRHAGTERLFYLPTSERTEIRGLDFRQRSLESRQRHRHELALYQRPRHDGHRLAPAAHRPPHQRLGQSLELRGDADPSVAEHVVHQPPRGGLGWRPAHVPPRNHDDSRVSVYPLDTSAAP